MPDRTGAEVIVGQREHVAGHGERTDDYERDAAKLSVPHNTTQVPPTDERLAC